MDTLGAMRIFARVVEAGSFSAAGRQLGLVPSSVSRQIGDLEDELSATLFHRTTRKLSLTEAGHAYHERAARILHEVDEAQLALSIGERLGRLGEVVTFEETGTYKLLFQIFAENPGELAAFYDQTLSPLVRYDEQYSTDLVLTLSTYLENDCNLAATAGTLIQRWLFFAEATHTVTLYYGAETA